MTYRLLLSTCVVLTALACSPAPAPTQTASPAVPDLSGAWMGRPPMFSISTADPRGQLLGKEPDIEYQPWALEKLMSEIPPTGPFGQPDKTTDPWVRYCEPNGPVRIYAHPGRTMFVQLADRVLILHEVMQQFRIVRLNGTHPPLEDLDPTSWGDSIGRYENGDTFVVDTIGLNGRAWLSQGGHPMSEKARIIERYKKVNDTLEWTVTIDDPGTYLKPVTLTRVLPRSKVPFMQSPWNCSVRDNTYYTDTLLGTAATPAK